MDSLIRYFDILRLIPKWPNAITTPELLKKLSSKGHQRTLRTLQRDLEKLSLSGFPISSSENTKPLAWFWTENAPKLQFPMMSSDEALTFKLVEQFLEPQLPLSVKTQLASYFSMASQTLKQSPLVHWPDKVRILPNWQALLPPQINADVLHVVYEALLLNRKFTATYRRRNHKVMECEVNPLGLVFKGGVVYLLATLFNYPDVKQLLMHRFTAAQIMDTPATKPSDFTLDRYIQSGEFDYPKSDDPVIALKLKINVKLHKHLSETPLAKDQHFTVIDDTSFYLEATVQNTHQLRWWLRGFADGVEVLEPLSLRQEFADDAKALGKLYLY